MNNNGIIQTKHYIMMNITYNITVVENLFENSFAKTFQFSFLFCELVSTKGVLKAFMSPSF